MQMKNTQLRFEGIALKRHKFDDNNFNTPKKYSLNVKANANEKNSHNNHEFIYERIQFTNQQILKLIDMLTGKGTKILSLFSNNKTVLQHFKEKHMIDNSYMKIALRKVLYQLANSRRIGNNLKGLSKQIMSQIQQSIIQLIKMEMKIFQRNQQIKRHEQVIKKGLQICKTQQCQNV